MTSSGKTAGERFVGRKLAIERRAGVDHYVMGQHHAELAGPPEGGMRVATYEPFIPLSPEARNWIAHRYMEDTRELAVAERFFSMMIEELAANDEKGNRPGWLTMTPAEAIAEMLYHAGKLSLAVREVGSGKAPDPRTAGFTIGDVHEFAADVANCALMVLDVTEPRAPHPAKDPVEEPSESPLGPAGLPPKPFKPRCDFGHGHAWVQLRAEHQCMRCGCMSSDWRDPVEEAGGA